MKIDARTMEWTRVPKEYGVKEDRVEITTEPHTDLWQRTYYHLWVSALISRLQNMRKRRDQGKFFGQVEV